MTTPNPLDQQDVPYLCGRSVRAVLYMLLGMILLGMITWRILPYYKYYTLEEAIAQKRAVVGMSREQALKSWGSPYKIDVTYTHTGVRRELCVFEDWIHSSPGSLRHTYLE